MNSLQSHRQHFLKGFVTDMATPKLVAKVMVSWVCRPRSRLHLRLQAIPTLGSMRPAGNLRQTLNISQPLKRLKDETNREQRHAKYEMRATAWPALLSRTVEDSLKHRRPVMTSVGVEDQYCYTATLAGGAQKPRGGLKEAGRQWFLNREKGECDS